MSATSAQYHDHDTARLRRLQTADLEVGVTDATQPHIQRHVVPGPPVTQRRLNFEHSRPRLLREMMAEATGVFFYVYPGIASTATFVLNKGEPQYSNLFQIGWAYAVGIAFAIIVCAPTSGGHLHPALTLNLAFWQGFPWRKVPFYIFAQIFGAFMAALVLVGQYWQEMNAFKLQLQAAGQPIVGMNTPASILCPFPALTQTNMGWVFLVEFFVDTYISLIIWACLDPANPFMSPVAAPFAIGLAFASMIWGFVDVTISTNTARDLGTRIVAAIFYGRGAFTYRNYSAISILVNIPAFFFATFYYEIVLRDSLQKIKKGHAVHEEGEEGLKRHLTKTGTLDLNEPMEQGVTRSVENPNNQTNGYQTGEKIKE